MARIRTVLATGSEQNRAGHRIRTEQGWPQGQNRTGLATGSEQNRAGHRIRTE